MMRQEDTSSNAGLNTAAIGNVVNGYRAPRPSLQEQLDTLTQAVRLLSKKVEELSESDLMVNDRRLDNLQRLRAAAMERTESTK